MKKSLIKSLIGFSAAFVLSHQASAQSQCSNQVPVYTHNPGAVSTSGDYSSSYPGWLAFDGNDSSMWISNTYRNSAWIAYQFSTSTRIDRYSIQFSNGTLTGRAPRDFQLQGYSNGAWRTLDRRTDQRNWLGFEKRSFTVGQPGFYSQYRLFIEQDNDDRAQIVAVSIGELSLESCIAAANLHGDWHEDYAQSGAGIEHYVPTSVDLGAARFRNMISFFSGGTGKIWRLAPNDAHYFVNTTWVLNGNRLTVTFTDTRWSSTAGTYDYVYEVLSAGSGNLRLKVISQTKR